MSTSTIARTGVTLTNDTGTPAAPNGDGTLLNNSWVQTFMDRIDALFSSNLTIGGLFSAEGFGTHTFSGSGTGANTLQVRNTSAGTCNYAGVTIGTDASSSQMRVYALSSTYSSTAFYVASGGAIECAGSGGLTIGASHAAGEIRFFANDTTNYRAKIVAGGHLVLNELTTNPGTSDCAADAAVAGRR